MNNTLFRLRINYQKQGRLRFLSHLEIVRALERLIRRAGLPYATTQGFSAHMRYAPGPALPVGTIGLDEYFDIWLTEYVSTEKGIEALRKSAANDLIVIGAAYVDVREKGLQATHVLEQYHLELVSNDLCLQGIQKNLNDLIARGSLNVVRDKKEKAYDLNQAVYDAPVVKPSGVQNRFSVDLFLRCSAQGSIKPESLLSAALGSSKEWDLISIARIVSKPDMPTTGS